MKSGMIVELPEYGQIQVIGYVQSGKMVELWGIGLLTLKRTMMHGQMSNQLVDDIYKACRKKDLESRYKEAKQTYLTEGERLQCIKDTVERLGENVDVKV